MGVFVLLKGYYFKERTTIYRKSDPMLTRRQPLPVEDAVNKVLDHVLPLEPEEILLEEADLRYLAEDILADQDVPAFDRSPYDGFAVLSSDTASASRETPIRLKVLETIGAGSVAEYPLQSGHAYRIMTGAAIPDEANAIVMLELAKDLKDENGNSYIEITRQFPEGHNISWQGEDTKKGTVMLKKGSRITPGVKAVLATFGYHKVSVYRQPVVGVIATGSELLEPSEPLVHGKIRNSNGPMILSMIKEAGAIPKYLGQLKDDLKSSIEAVERGLKEVDVLITTGGVSVGDFDFLPEIYEHLKADVLFNKVAMRPGSVTTVAALSNNSRLFGLSGNPSACFVGFSLFAGPYLKKLQGASAIYLDQDEAVLQKDFPKPNPFTRFVRCRVERRNGSWHALPIGLDKSNVVTSLAFANALMVLPGGTRGYQSGDDVHVILLHGEDRDTFCL